MVKKCRFTASIHFVFGEMAYYKELPNCDLDNICGWLSCLYMIKLDIDLPNPLSLAHKWIANLSNGAIWTKYPVTWLEPNVVFFPNLWNLIPPLWVPPENLLTLKKWSWSTVWSHHLFIPLLHNRFFLSLIAHPHKYN